MFSGSGARTSEKERVVVAVAVVVVVASLFSLAALVAYPRRVGSCRVGSETTGAPLLQLLSMMQLDRPVPSLPGIPCVRVGIRQCSGVNGESARRNADFPSPIHFSQLGSRSVSQPVIHSTTPFFLFPSIAISDAGKGQQSIEIGEKLS